MKVEFNELKLELNSCNEIIRILQEEMREFSKMAQPAWNNVNDDHNGKESVNSSLNDKWSHHSSNRRRKPQQRRRNLQQLPLQTSNYFEPLANLIDGNEYPKCLTFVNQIQVSSNPMTKRRSLSPSVKKTNNIKHNIVIIGDSHGWNCAAELQHNLGTKFAVSSYVKPGAGMSAITHTAKEEIGKLKSNDVVIMWRDLQTLEIITPKRP